MNVGASEVKLVNVEAKDLVSKWGPSQQSC